MGPKEPGQSPTIRELRIFGASLLLGFTLLGFLFWVRLKSGHASGEVDGSSGGILPFVLWACGIVGGVLPWLSPTTATGVHRAWMAMARVMSKVMIPVGLTLVFILFLPWFSFVRISDPLRKKLGAGDSYWEAHRDHEPTLERTLRPF